MGGADEAHFDGSDSVSAVAIPAGMIWQTSEDDFSVITKVFVVPSFALTQSNSTVSSCRQESQRDKLLDAEYNEKLRW